jgi:hypothetical protein
LAPHLFVAVVGGIWYSVSERGDFMPKRNNRLKEYFGFIPINPTVNFYECPCAGTLSNIPKAVQTEETVLLALENEEQYSSPVLKYTSKKLKTDAICDKAVAANVLNFLYTPQEYRTAERCLDAVRRDTDMHIGEPLSPVCRRMYYMAHWGMKYVRLLWPQNGKRSHMCQRNISRHICL